MLLASTCVIVFVIAFHVWALVLEMFLWTKPIGLRVFKQKPEQALASKKLAQNQGLYNGFLAAGLAWGLMHPTPEASFQIKMFFLMCVVIAGVFGAYTVGRNILFFQAVPAGLAIALLLLA